MRTIDQITQYRRDIKREAKGQHRDALTDELAVVVSKLATDQAL